MQVGSQQKVEATEGSVPETLKTLYNASYYRKLTETQRTAMIDLAHQIEKLKKKVKNNNTETDNENHTQTPAHSWCTIT